MNWWQIKRIIIAIGIFLATIVAIDFVLVVVEMFLLKKSDLYVGPIESLLVYAAAFAAAGFYLQKSSFASGANAIEKKLLLSGQGLIGFLLALLLFCPYVFFLLYTLSALFIGGSGADAGSIYFFTFILHIVPLIVIGLVWFFTKKSYPLFAKVFIIFALGLFGLLYIGIWASFFQAAQPNSALLYK